MFSSFAARQTGGGGVGGVTISDGRHGQRYPGRDVPVAGTLSWVAHRLDHDATNYFIEHSAITYVFELIKATSCDTV